jgi:hypothetical protein
MLNDTRMPTLYISVQGHSGSYSYSVPVAFSSFEVNRTLIPQLPFTHVNGYYLDQERQLVSLALNYSFTSSRPFIAWNYRNGTSPSFVSPISREPGNLSKIYGYLFGSNNTIYANLDGGGGSLANIQRRQLRFQALAMIGPQTGGATSLWVMDPNGSIAVNETRSQHDPPPPPEGTFGSHSPSFLMSVNGTYQFGITNLWGEQRLSDIRKPVHLPLTSGWGVLSDDLLRVPRCRALLHRENCKQNKVVGSRFSLITFASNHAVRGGSSSSTASLK